MRSAPTRITLMGGAVAYVDAHPSHVADAIRIAEKKGGDRVNVGGNWIRLDQITAVLAPTENHS